MSKDFELPPPPRSLEPTQGLGGADRKKKVRIVALGAICVGAFLPWASFTAPFIGSVTKNGINGDGVVTLILAGIALATNLRTNSLSDLSARHVPTALISAVCAIVAVMDMNDVNRFSDESDLAVVEVGVGLWVTLVGALVAFGVSLGRKSPMANERRVIYQTAQPRKRALRRRKDTGSSSR